MSKIYPGQNSTQRFQFVGAFTIGKAQRPNLEGNPKGPAPNQYNQSVPKQVQRYNSPSWKFDKVGRTEEKIFSTPGPTKYAFKSSIEKSQENPKGLNFQKQAERKGFDEELNKDYNLGPGQYEQNQAKGFKNVSYSFSSKFVPDYTPTYRETPGPGTYDPPIQDTLNQSSILDKSHKSIKSVSSVGTFGQQKRVLTMEQIDEVPGVGNYKLDRIESEPIVKKSRLPQGQRFKAKKLSTYDNLVGPGSYNIRSSFDLASNKKKPFSFGLKLSNQLLPSSHKTPGPAYYSSSTTNQNKNGIKFSTQRKEKINQRDLTPGPGMYYKDENSYQEIIIVTDPQKKPQYFGSAARQIMEGKNKDVPGPGQYDQESLFGGDGPGMVIKQEENHNRWTKKKVLPGPGQYTMQEKENGAKITIGRKIKQNSLHTESYPGPGQYKVSKDFLQDVKGPKISKLSNYKGQQTSSHDEQPAPGQYEIKSTIAGMPDYLLPTISNSPQKKKPIESSL